MMIERELDIPKAGMVAIEIAAFDAFDAGEAGDAGDAGGDAGDAGDTGDAGEDEEEIILHGPECEIYIFISCRIQHEL